MTRFPSSGRVFGVDPGSRRIGIALSDQDRRVATPLVVIERKKDAQVHRRAIADLAGEWEVSGLVVGLPLSLDGGEGPAAVAAREEAAALADATGLPVTTYDERFTTVTAERAMAEAEVPKGDRRAVVDKLAAAIMLQSWLDRRAATGDDSEEST